MRRIHRSAVRLGVAGLLLGSVAGPAGGAAATVTAGSPWRSNVSTPLPVSGTWDPTDPQGLHGSSAPMDNAIALSDARAGSKFVYAADVTVDAATPYGVASLVIRAGDDALSYRLSIDPNLDQVRLFDVATGNDLAARYTTPLSPGTPYRLQVEADGPRLRVSIGGLQAIVVDDLRYDEGLVGFGVYNGSAWFQNVELHETRTNLVGWSTSTPTWTPGPRGWRATAAPDGNTRATAATTSDDFSYQADLLVHDQYAVGSLHFRANADASAGYAVELDPNLDRLRLYRIDGNVTLATKQVVLDVGEVYRVKVVAEGSSIRVYLQTDLLHADGYAPALTVDDTEQTGGHLGLGAYNGSVSFDAAEVSDLSTGLHGWSATGGSWQPDLRGVKAAVAAGNSASRTAVGELADVVLTGDLTVHTSNATAALLLRASASGATGYAVTLDPAADQVRLVDVADGRIIATASHPLQPGVRYHLEITANGPRIDVVLDGRTPAALSVPDTRYAAGRVGLKVAGGTAWFADVEAEALAGHARELYRPQYHYTQARGKASDPNGLVYYRGEYHLFHQDVGRWGHAVSTDLVNWKRLPIALPFSPLGHSWSGSAVVDEHDASGLFDGGSGLVAFYSIFNPDKLGGDQSIGVAYSRDAGRTWQFHTGNPVIGNPGGPTGGWNFRDPKVVFDEARNAWVMVVSGGDHVRFFTSTNLLDWQHTSSFGYGDYVHAGTWECPDFFPLAVDGEPARMKWVLAISTGPKRETAGSTSEYFVGDFDGQTFSSDNPASTVLRNDLGRDFYAAVSFSGVPDGRRIWLGWMSNWDYAFSAPTKPFNGQLSVPRSLELTEVPGEGIRLTQEPIAELAALRGAPATWSDVTVGPEGPNPLAAQAGTAYEIEVEVELPATGAATEFGLRVREGGDQRTVLGYDVAARRLFVDRTGSGLTAFTQYFDGRSSAPLPPMGNRVRIRAYVDESSVEVFGNDGRAVLSDQIFPDGARDRMSLYATGGQVRVVSMTMHPLRNVWTAVAAPGLRMDRPGLNLGPGGQHRLFASTGAVGDQALVWSSSNSSVAQVTGSDERSADVTAVAPGRAVVTATTLDGQRRGSTVVTVGHFDSDLTGWTSSPAAEWVPTGAGITGSFDLDSNHMATETATDFGYEADVTIGADGGAGSMIFRANADGSDGYYLNLDPNLRALRLFTKIDGRFDESQVLATVPMLIRNGATYHVRLIASGNRLQAFLDDDSAPVVDVQDSTFGSGRVGVNVFGGKASYQNVRLFPS